MTEDAAELDALRNSIRRVLTEHASRERVQRFVKSNELYDQELWGEAAKLGWLALSIPEADGGLGLGMSGAALLYEELGRSLAPVPVLGTLLVAEAVAAAGTPAQKTAWLPDLASGAVAASLEVIDPKHKTPSVRLRRRPGATSCSREMRTICSTAPLPPSYCSRPRPRTALITWCWCGPARTLWRSKPRPSSIAPVIWRTLTWAIWCFPPIACWAKRRCGRA